MRDRRAFVMIRIKVGCELGYTVHTPTAGVFIVQPAQHLLLREELAISGGFPVEAFEDLFGNRCQRATLSPGTNVIRYDALLAVSAEADKVDAEARAVPPGELPSQLLRFTLPSRYAETDQLMRFAWETFGQIPAGWTRARAICDWVRSNIAYQRGVSSPHWSATDAIAKRVGVCRDRAHAVIALARAFNMPARYAVSYLPDIGVEDDGNPMDFHAYAEIWLDGGWFVFDPHDARPRRGRVLIAAGLDAADAAFATLYGGARLTTFRVWADPEGPSPDHELELDDPTPALRPTPRHELEAPSPWTPSPPLAPRAFSDETRI